MRFVLELIFILLLGFIFYQDVKDRLVSVILLCLGIILGGYLHFDTQYYQTFLWNISFNILVVGILFGILSVYAKLKIRKGIFEVFGKGDVLFFILMAVSLPIVSFLVVFVFSLIFSLTIYLLLQKKMKEKTVPLAGLQSVFLGFVIILNLFIESIQIYAL